MAKAWIYQNSTQKKMLGDKAPWIVSWYEPNGKRRSKTIGAKSKAEKYKRKIEGELTASVYEPTSRKKWSEFRAEYESSILGRLDSTTTTQTKISLAAFERIVEPAKLTAIDARMIEQFIAVRLKEPGKKPKSTVSPATVNKDLRHLKAAFNVAHRWGYMPKVPRIQMIREQHAIGEVMTPKDFQAIYNACDAATKPHSTPFAPVDWWRGLLFFGMTTGWRIEEILSLRWDDVDLETGRIVTRSEANKAGRDEIDFVPQPTIEHLQLLRNFTPLVFFWPHHRRTVLAEFQAIQMAAGIQLPCRQSRKHECTDACHLYGFHALRRGYASLNLERMPAAVLQRKMRHKSFQTTQRYYVELGDKMKDAAASVFIPHLSKKPGA